MDNSCDYLKREELYFHGGRELAQSEGKTARPEGVTDLEEHVAKHEAEIAALKKDLAEVRSDLKAIRSKTDKWSGVLGIVALAIPTMIGGLIGWFAHK